jgi:hypothetical protein
MLLLLLIAAAPADFLPCVEGLEVEYRTGSGATVVDRVAGLKDRHCRIERRTIRDGREEKDAYLREILPDRVLSAGYASTPLAQRPPLLVAPIEAGKGWQFNRVRYRIAGVGACAVGALAFDRCVTIEMIGDDGSKNLSRYAEGVGLVEQRFGDAHMVAVAVRVPKSETARKRPAPAR